MRISRSASVAFTSLLVMCGSGVRSAVAGNVTDPVYVTVGAPNANVTGFSLGSYGATNPTATSDGYAYRQISGNSGVCKPNGCTAGNNLFSVGG